MDRDRTLPDGRPRILVVDDDPIIRKLVLRALEPLQCREVLEAEDGLAACELLERGDIDIVITDVVMPRMDGLELIRWANNACPGLIWIILSGIDSFENAVEAIRLGALDFLPKPPHVEKLRLSVRNAWRHEELVRERERLDRELESRVEQLESLCRLLEEQSAKLDRDFERAEVIQRSLLPRRPPPLAGFRVDSLYRPGRNVGGDLYDVVALDERHAAIVIADACGHGVSAAMLSVLFKLRLQMRDTATNEPLAPARALALLNRSLRENLPTPGVFVTACYGLLDLEDASLRLASAGHPPLLWMQGGGGVREIERTGPALGLYDDAAFQETQILFERGDRLLLYTDGLLEGGALDLEAMAARFAATSLDEPGPLLRSLFDAASEKAEPGERDDVTMLLLTAAQAQGDFDDAVEERSATPPSPRGARLSWAETDDSTFIAIAGRATWMDGSDLYEAAESLIDRDRNLILDLSSCEYLDSTVLGTIHEVCVRADACGLSARLQGLGCELLPMFEELDMEVVLQHAVDTPLPAPESLQPLGGDVDPKRRQLRVLHAHESLASLSAANRAQLTQVLGALRAELRPKD